MRTGKWIWSALYAGLLITTVITTVAGCLGTPAAQTPRHAPPDAAPGRPVEPGRQSRLGSGTMSKLDGIYTVNWEAYELAKALGDRWGDAEENAGEMTLEINGTDVWFDGTCRGKAEITGDHIVVKTTTDPTDWHCGAGPGAAVIDADWRMHGRTLRLTDWYLSDRGPGSLDWNFSVFFGLKPLHRVN